MGLSANSALKLAAQSAYARGDVATGDRLMKEYNESVYRAKKHAIERKLKEEARRKKLEDERKKKNEEAERKKKIR